jgi:hypothetical protein
MMDVSVPMVLVEGPSMSAEESGPAKKVPRIVESLDFLEPPSLEIEEVVS